MNTHVILSVIFILASFSQISCNQGSSNNSFSRSDSGQSSNSVSSKDLGVARSELSAEQLEEIKQEVLASTIYEIFEDKIDEIIDQVGEDAVEIDGFVFEEAGSLMREFWDSANFDDAGFDRPIGEILEEGGIALEDVYTSEEGFEEEKLAQIHELYEDLLYYGPEGAFGGGLSDEGQESDDNSQELLLAKTYRNINEKGCKDSIKANIGAGAGMAAVAVEAAACGVASFATAGAAVAPCMAVINTTLVATGATAIGGTIGALTQCDLTSNKPFDPFHLK